ncbi:hypothetical protein FRB99_008037 [Tulasnella sp. 403]|nr:hypothetical protein FRB99_008037 [Tulasnella sp. 403]
MFGFGRRKTVKKQKKDAKNGVTDGKDDAKTTSPADIPSKIPLEEPSPLAQAKAQAFKKANPVKEKGLPSFAEFGTKDVDALQVETTSDAENGNTLKPSGLTVRSPENKRGAQRLSVGSPNASPSPRRTSDGYRDASPSRGTSPGAERHLSPLSTRETNYQHHSPQHHSPQHQGLSPSQYTARRTSDEYGRNYTETNNNWQDPYQQHPHHRQPSPNPSSYAPHRQPSPNYVDDPYQPRYSGDQYGLAPNVPYTAPANYHDLYRQPVQPPAHWNDERFQPQYPSPVSERYYEPPMDDRMHASDHYYSQRPQQQEQRGSGLFGPRHTEPWPTPGAYGDGSPQPRYQQQQHERQSGLFGPRHSEGWPSSGDRSPQPRYEQYRQHSSPAPPGQWNDPRGGYYSQPQSDLTRSPSRAHAHPYYGHQRAQTVDSGTPYGSGAWSASHTDVNAQQGSYLPPTREYQPPPHTPSWEDDQNRRRRTYSLQQFPPTSPSPAAGLSRQRSKRYSDHAQYVAGYPNGYPPPHHQHPHQQAPHHTPRQGWPYERLESLTEQLERTHLAYENTYASQSTQSLAGGGDEGRQNHHLSDLSIYHTPSDSRSRESFDFSSSPSPSPIERRAPSRYGQREGYGVAFPQSESRTSLHSVVQARDDDNGGYEIRRGWETSERAKVPLQESPRKRVVSQKVVSTPPPLPPRTPAGSERYAEHEGARQREGVSACSEGVHGRQLPQPPVSSPPVQRQRRASGSAGMNAGQWGPRPTPGWRNQPAMLGDQQPDGRPAEKGEGYAALQQQQQQQYGGRESVGAYAERYAGSPRGRPTTPVSSSPSMGGSTVGNGTYDTSHQQAVAGYDDMWQQQQLQSQQVQPAQQEQGVATASPSGGPHRRRTTVSVTGPRGPRSLQSGPPVSGARVAAR